MQIKGTFLDEISHDIPHQNWGEKEWDADFGHMHRAGIEHVILIRCGYRRWQTFSSQVLNCLGVHPNSFKKKRPKCDGLSNPVSSAI